MTGELFRYVLPRVAPGTAIDIVHGCHAYPDGYGLTAVAADRDCLLTVMCHGHFLNNYATLPLGVRKRVRRTLEQAAHVFCVSEALKAKVREIMPDTAVSVVPIGATPENYPTDRERELREMYSIDPESAVVLFCGQFIERKGIADVIDSLDRFPTDHVEYVFVGHGGDLLSDLQAAVESPKTPENIRIVSGLETPKLREWYAMADLLLLPSYEEGRPTVIYEAMAAETAVLSTRIDGVSEQVIAEETGILIEPGDQVALIEALETFTAQKQALQRMGKNGKHRLLSNRWTWDAHAEQIMDIHTDLLCP